LKWGGDGGSIAKPSVRGSTNVGGRGKWRGRNHPKHCRSKKEYAGEGSRRNDSSHREKIFGVVGRDELFFARECKNAKGIGLRKSKKLLQWIGPEGNSIAGNANSE